MQHIHDILLNEVNLTHSYSNSSVGQSVQIKEVQQLFILYLSQWSQYF